MDEHLRTSAAQEAIILSRELAYIWVFLGQTKI